MTASHNASRPSGQYRTAGTEQPTAEDIKEFLQNVGRRARQTRRMQDRTQEEIAVASGMSRSFISLIEQGAHGIDIVRLLRLAAALEISLHELLDQ